MAAAEQPKDRIERQTAHKVSISEILENDYIKTKDWNPNFILARGNEKISRVNIIGVVLSNEVEQFGQVMHRNIIIDDGTGTISLKNFENPDIFSHIKISDIILVIGKPREYGAERYVLPEIIRKTDQKWMEHRKLEIFLMKKSPKKENPPEKIVTQEEMVQNGKAQEKESKIELVYSIVKSLDAGAGADYDEVIKKAGFPEAESAIRKLMENGDIFEIRAGKLKVL
jgi:RPA family protein